MAFGLKMRKFERGEIDKRVRDAAEILDIGQLLDRKPRQLSGGQRQRVAMGRAIVRDPKVFLFDEPLSNLDAKLRVQMRVELKKLHERLGTTAIYVTHVDKDDDERVDGLELKGADDREQEPEQEAAHNDRKGNLDRDDNPFQDRGKILRDQVWLEECFEKGVHRVSSAMKALARSPLGAPNICAGGPSSTISP